MKKILFIAGLIPVYLNSFAQLSGTVSDSVSGAPLPGATISIEYFFLAATTDADGNFSFPDLKEKSVRMKISHVGYNVVVMDVSLPNEKMRVLLAPRMYLSEEVVVTATRASDKSPTAFSMVRREELEKKNLGQDIPYLLQTTPSLVVTSDAGAGVGYTGIRIRGSDATRVNVTINGVPVNDPEEHGVFWVDLPDLASSIGNIQVQRGIGTSTNGVGAFGASVNILTAALSPEPFAMLGESYGSFNTWKHTLNFGTGMLKNKFAFEGRLSKITSDGFVDRATSDLKSFYLSGGYYGAKSSLRAVIFSGREKTYQSWNGVPEAKLKSDHDALVTHYYNNLGYLYNTTEDSLNLFESDPRTYNVFNYKNQTDNYQQDYYQLHYSFAAARNLTLNAALHYTRGQGYYEEFKYSQSFADYKLDDLIIGRDTISSTDLIRQKWLDNDFYGFTFSSVYETSMLQLILGAAGNQYKNRHFDQIIWAQHASNGSKDFIYDDNDATKNDFNVFAKAIYTLLPRLHLFGDLQYRTVDYTFMGFDENVQSSRQHVAHNFFNPKGGITYEVSKKSKVYASYAIGHKEPVRKDYVASSALSRPDPEHMQDLEAGYKFAGKRFSAGVNLYFMNYRDQLILTGEINDVGEYTRTNVPESSRKGIELEAGWSLSKKLNISGNITLSENRIRRFTEYVDTYDAGFNYTGQTQIQHSNTDIIFSPGVISSAIISWTPVKNFTVELINKYVGDQYLDNTSDETRKLDAYMLNDLFLQYRFSLSHVKEIALKLAVYNLLGEEYESNGYTYGYFYSDMLVQENFYYPQAGINWLGGVTVKF